MSGHTDDVLPEPDQLIHAGVGFLQKPFTLEELFRKLRETIDAQPGNPGSQDLVA